MRIADAEGFDALSMRRLAAELDAGTMTLYHYVRTKDELLTLVIDAVMGEVVLGPDEPMPEHWRDAMTLIAERSRASLLRHPWILDITDDPGFGPNSVRHFDQSLQAVASLPIPLSRTSSTSSAPSTSTSSASASRSATGDEAPRTRATRGRSSTSTALVATGDYPQLAALAEEFGLERPGTRSRRTAGTRTGSTGTCAACSTASRPISRNLMAASAEGVPRRELGIRSDTIGHGRSSHPPAGPPAVRADPARPSPDRAGTSHSTLAAYEAGRKVPTVETLDRVVRAAGYELAVELTPNVGGHRPGRTRRGAGRGARSSRRASRPATRRRSSSRASAPAVTALAAEDRRAAPVARRRGHPARVRRCAGARVVHAAGPRHDRHRPERLRRRARVPAEVLGALPAGGRLVGDGPRAVIERDGQARLWWDTTPVDLFVNTTEFHTQIARRARWSRSSKASTSRSSRARTSRCSRRSSTAPRTGPTSRRWPPPAPSTPIVSSACSTRYLGAGDERITRLQSLT